MKAHESLRVCWFTKGVEKEKNQSAAGCCLTCPVRLRDSRFMWQWWAPSPAGDAGLFGMNSRIQKIINMQRLDKSLTHIVFLYSCWYFSHMSAPLTCGGLLQLPTQIRPIPSQPPHVAPPQAEAGWPNLCPINWFTMRTSPRLCPTLELQCSQPAAPPHLVVQRPSCMCVYVSACAHGCRQEHFPSSCLQSLERVFQHLSFKKTYIIISISFSNIQHYICVWALSLYVHACVCCTRRNVHVKQ